MNVLTIKTSLTVGFVGLAALLMTACNSGQPPAAEAGPTAAEVATAPIAQPALFNEVDEPDVTAAAHYAVTTASTLPDEQPAVEERSNGLPVMRTRLDEATSVANVRRGPGLEFEVLGRVDDSLTLIVTGRAAGSNWLQIDYEGQSAWLAGDLIAHQSLIHLLPAIDTGHLRPEPVATEPVAVATPTTEATIEKVSEAEQEAAILNRLQSLNCAETPVRGFGQVWQKHPEVRPLLGCPFTNFRRAEHATAAAVQTFQGGWMLWLETDTVQNVDPIYVFFDKPNAYIRFGDRALMDAHSYGPTPRGFYKVGDRFAKVYWEELTAQQRGHLGLATAEARDSSGAFQEFAHGRMFWAGEADTIYVIYEGAYDFDGDGQTVWLRGWQSYEDTFDGAGGQ